MAGVPSIITKMTGLLTWPKRGSADAGLIEATWRHRWRRETITLTYERQEGLWCVATRNDFTMDGARTEMFSDVRDAWCAAVDMDGVIVPHQSFGRNEERKP